MSEENINNLLKYKKPWVNQSSDGDENAEENPKAGVYLPCIPNLDLVVHANEGYEVANDSATALLERALIKCKQENTDENTANLIGKASGKRSAILIDNSDNSFIRLKGCGNLDQGFPIEPMQWPFGSSDVRGCQFSNTVYREMVFQKKVNEMLEQNKLVGANLPLGLWQYGKFQEIPEMGIKHECVDEIVKYCGIFKTVGDRRLQTNLF